MRPAKAVLAAVLVAVPAAGGWGGAQAAELPPFACAGPFVPTASQGSLQKFFGPPQVIYRSEPMGEGTFAMATVLFPRDQARRAVITWMVHEKRRRPATVRVSVGTQWKTPQGIGLGTSLKTVERINGRPFTLAGFGWDYEGTSLDFQGGALDGGPCRLILRFSPVAADDAAAQAMGPMLAALTGDGEFRSDDPGMQAVDPVVYEMVLQWD